MREMDVAAAAEKAKAEAAARVAEKEATQHLELEQIKAQGATQSGAYVAAVLAGLSAAGKGLLATLSSPTHLRQLAVAFGVFAALYFSAKETARRGLRGAAGTRLHSDCNVRLAIAPGA